MLCKTALPEFIIVCVQVENMGKVKKIPFFTPGTTFNIPCFSNIIHMELGLMKHLIVFDFGAKKMPIGSD